MISPTEACGACQDPEECVRRQQCYWEAVRAHEKAQRANTKAQQRAPEIARELKLEEEEDDDWSKLTPGKIQAMMPKQIGPVIVYPDNEYSRKLAIKLARARPGEMMALTIDELATLSEFFVWPPRS